jgi:hypothetical protein
MPGQFLPGARSGVARGDPRPGEPGRGRPQSAGDVEDLRPARMNTAADLVERGVSETLTCYAFPDISVQDAYQ